MSDFVPDLDTVEFERLVEQARAVVPRFAPDWTDHNLHDPGMTVIDLLAWIVDQQVYRTGHVGERHHRVFAALLGQRPREVAPARGLVWPDRPAVEGRSLVAGTGLAARQHPGLRFALERDLFVSPARLTGDPALPLGFHRQAATLAFDRPLGTLDRIAHVAVGFEVVPPPGAPVTEGDLGWGPVTYAYRTGRGEWTRLTVPADGTAGLARTGVVVLAIPPRPDDAGPSRLRLSLRHGFFPVVPQIRAAAINVLPIVQRQRAGRLTVETGTGRPDQFVPFDTAGLLPQDHDRRLVVTVGGEPWQETGDLSRSGPADPHYVLEPDGIRFGNGVNGRTPGPGRPIAHEEFVRTAGAAGNLRPGLVWSLDADRAAYGRNRHALTGGRSAETSDDFAVAARAVAAGRAAMVTGADLVAAAFALPGMAVARAEVLPGFDRRLPGRTVDGVRTLVVIPAAGPEAITAAYLAAVTDRLAPRRVLGERLLVQGPAVTRADIRLTVTTEPGTPPDAVATAAEKAVRDLLSAVTPVGGGHPWRLGRALTTEDVRAAAAGVPGVVDVPSVRLAVAGNPPGPGPITVPRDGLIVPATVEIGDACR